MRRKITFRLVAVILSLLVGGLILELSIRALVPAVYWRFTDATDDWTADARLGWTQSGDLQSISSSAPAFHTNQDGLQPASAIRRKTTARRILFIGDSTCVGRGVEDESRVHHVLSRLLQEQGYDVEVLNAGVQGYSTDQALLRLEYLHPLYKPDIVLYAFCSNDLGGNSGPTAYGMGKPWFELDGEDTLHQRPFVLTPIPKGMGGGLSRWLQESAVYRLCQPSLLQIRAAANGWQDRLLLSPEGFYTDPRMCEEVNWKLFGALLERMQDFCLKHRGEFAYYAHPALEEVWEPMVRKSSSQSPSFNRYAIEERLSEIGKGRNVRFCAMIDYFRRNQSRGPFHLLPRDPHCNASGYRLQAEVLASFLVRYGLVRLDRSQ